MANLTLNRNEPRSMFAPTAFDYVLAAGALAMLAAAVTAVLRGRVDWGVLPPVIWFHLATICSALILTPAMLIRRKGDRRHRQLGYVWVVLMVATALGSFFIRFTNDGGFSVIHILSVLTLVVCFRLVRAAQRHDIKAHLRNVRGIVIGALLIAGFRTFPFDRLLGQWLQGESMHAGQVEL